MQITKDRVDKHAARVAVAIFKAVDERHELLPYMKSYLMRSIRENIDTLTDKEIDLYMDSAKLRNLLDGQTKKKGSV